MDNQTQDNQKLNDVAPPASNNKPEEESSDTSAQRPNIPQVISNNHKPKKKWPKILAAILILLLAAGGWYLYDQNKKDNNQSAGSVTQNKDIEQLNIGLLTADYGKLYPDWSVPSSYSYLTNGQMFEGLVRYENKSKIAPLLVTDWTNPDDNTWVFNLKSGVKFHDGNTMQADDVKYSLDKIRTDETDFAGIFTSTIKSVKAMNDNQVEIKTSEADPTLLNKLAFLYIIDAQLPKNSEPSQAGTGPYQIKPGTKPTTKELQMVAFDGYHGNRPTTRAVNFGSEPTDKDLVKAFQDGKYNIVGPMGIEDVAKSDAIKFVTSEPEVSFIGFNTLKPGPLQKAKVREAVRYAVDPAKLGEAQGDKVTPISQIVPESIPGYNPAIMPYKQDFAKARALLKEAGYPNGLTMELSYSSDKAFAEELASELKQANIKANLKFYDDFGAFLDNFLAGNAEMFTVVYSSDVLDGLDVYQSTVNGTGNYESKDLDKTLAEVAKTVDPEKRLKLLQDAAVIVDKDVAVVPLSTRDTLWLMDEDYNITQDMPSAYLSAYLYKTSQK